MLRSTLYTPAMLYAALQSFCGAGSKLKRGAEKPAPNTRQASKPASQQSHCHSNNAHPFYVYSATSHYQMMKSFRLSSFLFAQPNTS